MIHSIIPQEMIFSNDTQANISYIRKNGVIMEVENGFVRRIISTNPTDFLENELGTDITYQKTGLYH